MTDDNATPESVAEAILSGAQAAPAEAGAAAAATRRVCVLPVSGRFRLQWSVTSPASSDWIGLYASVTAPDSAYIGGAWQWATADPQSYDTSVPVQPNYEARYLVWSSSASKYVSVARTGAFPNVVVSSNPVTYPRVPTTTEWSTLLGAFPSLVKTDVFVTAPQTNIYNCIAWSLGLDDRWINPISPLAAFQAQYQAWGQKTMPTLASYAKIDGWGASTTVTTHGDKTYTGYGVGVSGLWESKLGPYLRITHGRQQLTGTNYGSVITSFAAGYSISYATLEVLQMIQVRALDEEEAGVLQARLAAVSPDLASQFEAKYAAWKEKWFTGELFFSSNTRDLTRIPEYGPLKALGTAILPLVVDKLRDPAHFPALVLYDDLQPSKELVLSYAGPDDPQMLEGEQARAARTVLQWVVEAQK